MLFKERVSFHCSRVFAVLVTFFFAVNAHAEESTIALQDAAQRSAQLIAQIFDGKRPECSPVGNSCPLIAQCPAELPFCVRDSGGEGCHCNATLPLLSRAKKTKLRGSKITVNLKDSLLFLKKIAAISVPKCRETEDGGFTLLSRCPTSKPYCSRKAKKGRPVCSALITKKESIIKSSSASIDMVSSPIITPRGGTYGNSVVVTITNTGVKGSEVYYTLDGSVPSTRAIKYTSPFTLDKTTTINAQAFLVGKKPSFIVTAQFIVGSQPSATPTSSSGRPTPPPPLPTTPPSPTQPTGGANQLSILVNGAGSTTVGVGGSYTLLAKLGSQNYFGSLDALSIVCNLYNPAQCSSAQQVTAWGSTRNDGTITQYLSTGFPVGIYKASFRPTGSSLAWSNQITVTVQGTAPAATPTSIAPTAVPPTATPRPASTATSIPVFTPTNVPTSTSTPTATSTPNNGGGGGGGGTPGAAIPLDSEEVKLLDAINFYRSTKFQSPFLPSIALSNGADQLSRDNAARGVLSTIDSAGRNPDQRARAFGYLPSATINTLVGRGATFDAVLSGWKADASARAVLEYAPWKTASVARAYDSSTGQYYWTADFASYWDRTIPLPGEDSDGQIDGNPGMRTRPPSDLMAQGYSFTGYGDTGEWYQGLHCPAGVPYSDPRSICWRDAIEQGNPSMDAPSNIANFTGLFHIQFTLSPTKVKHFTDCVGYDSTGYSMELTINSNGTYTQKGYRAYDTTPPNVSGTWTSVKSTIRDEELVTFRASGKLPVTIRLRATSTAQGRMITMFAVDGGFSDFVAPFPQDDDYNDDPQIILTPGLSCFFGPH